MKYWGTEYPIFTIGICLLIKPLSDSITRCIHFIPLEIECIECYNINHRHKIETYDWPMSKARINLRYFWESFTDLGMDKQHNLRFNYGTIIDDLEFDY